MLVALLAISATAQAEALPPQARALSVHRRERTLTLFEKAVREAGGSRAHAAIVGGAPTSIEQVPWQVVVFAVAEVEGEAFILLCGGSVVRDYSNVLTAGHCAYNPFTGQPLPPEDFVVEAGVSNLNEKSSTSQARFVSGVRPHPYFHYAQGPGAPDDVAELQLETPLTSSSAVSTVALPTSTTPPAEGTSAVLSGFGEEEPEIEELNGALYSLGETVGFARPCGGEGDALFVCASTPTGTVCRGDSGGGLLAGGQLIGVVDTVAIVGGRVCVAGADDGFANVTAPEVLDFVDGSETPPRAPQGGGAVIEGVLRAGQSLSCLPGLWSGDPAYSYAFVDSANNQALQRGSASTYALTSADVGRTILCEVQATNAGGTGIGRTPALPAIQEGPSTGSTSSSQTGESSTTSSTGSPSTSGETGGVLGTKAQAPSAAQIAALLSKALVPTGKGAKIATLAKAGGYTLTFAAPEAGTASIAWYHAGGLAASGAAAKRSLVASGRRTFAKAGSGPIVVKVTAAGRRWLKGRKRAALLADGSFTPSTGSPVTVSKGFVLSH